MPSRYAIAIALIALPAAGLALEVYKCTSPQGGVAFQDRPCAPDASQDRLHVTGDTQVPPPPVADAQPPPATRSAAVSPSPPPPSKPLPALWLCLNVEDGSQYVSRNGPTPPRRVPLGVFGFPRKSLAEAYRPGSNVMSAPELSKPPVDASPRASAAASYTEIRDPCVRADATQTCAWLRGEYDRTNDELGRARFNDETTRLQTRLDSLRSDLDGCR